MLQKLTFKLCSWLFTACDDEGRHPQWLVNWRKKIYPDPIPPTREQLSMERIQGEAEEFASQLRIIDSLPIEEEDKDEMRAIKRQEFRDRISKIV